MSSDWEVEFEDLSRMTVTIDTAVSPEDDQFAEVIAMAVSNAGGNADHIEDWWPVEEEPVEEEPELTPSDYLRPAFVAAKSRLTLAEQQLEALSFICNNFGDRYTGNDPFVAEHSEALRGVIYQRVVQAQRDVIAFGALVGGDCEQEAKRIAYLTFLNHRYSMRNLLNTHGFYDWQMTDATERKLKAEIHAAVYCENPDHSHQACEAPALVHKVMNQEELIHELEQSVLRWKEQYEAYVSALTEFKDER